MLRWSIAFFLVALLAAIFGFTDIASGAAWVGKVLFFVFLACFVFSFVTGLFRVRRQRRIVVRVQQPMR
ncbi:MAG TPA: DUF1328 domain-containing protein [Planctomycetota bacterium]|jgi:uncharacterized membrane protein YtjA (UPF0391 family)|nr:DUF1328 domain-containing protein [Planctomycetota bacterium]